MRVRMLGTRSADWTTGLERHHFAAAVGQGRTQGLIEAGRVLIVSGGSIRLSGRWSPMPATHAWSAGWELGTFWPLVALGASVISVGMITISADVEGYSKEPTRTLCLKRWRGRTWMC